MTLYIKNMVCDRCKAAVRGVFADNGIEVDEVGLGVVRTAGSVPAAKLDSIRRALEAQGFCLLQDGRQKTVERIKALVIEMLRHSGGGAQGRNVSAFLADRLHSDYSALSKLFSAETGTTIEKYVIAQKVELAKELISYGEMSLTEIANRMGYSSVAYLSAQFKAVTGMTPSQYKNSENKSRRELDRV